MKKNYLGILLLLLSNALNAQFNDAKSLVQFSKTDFITKIETLKKKGWITDIPLRKTYNGKSMIGFIKKTENGSFILTLTKFTMPDSKKVVNVTDLYFPYDNTFAEYLDELKTSYKFKGIKGENDKTVGYSEKNLMIIVKIKQDAYTSKWVQEIEITTVKENEK